MNPAETLIKIIGGPQKKKIKWYQIMKCGPIKG